MAHVLDLISHKGTRVYTIHPQATVYEATSKMNQHKVGCLVVASRDQPDEVVGIFTERDVLRRVVAQLRYPDLVTVAEVMTATVHVCTPATLIEEAAAVMQEFRIRHLPVVDDNERLAGMISIGDVNAWHVRRANETINELSEYIHGRT